MTREEAIRRLQNFKETADGTYEWSVFVNTDDLKAFDMAINALSNIETIKERSYLEGFHEALKMLVKQEPKVGHWIMTNDYLTTAYGSVDYVKCSCCGEDSLEEGDYCPSCGARMRGEQNAE